MQVLAKITINKNLFNKVMSFWLRFAIKRDFDCEQVEQQTSQTELKHVSVVRLSKSRLRASLTADESLGRTEGIPVGHLAVLLVWTLESNLCSPRDKNGSHNIQHRRGDRSQVS